MGRGGLDIHSSNLLDVKRPIGCCVNTDCGFPNTSLAAPLKMLDEDVSAKAKAEDYYHFTAVGCVGCKVTLHNDD